MAGAGHQGPQHVERGAHLAHQIIGRDGADDLRRMQDRLRTVRTVVGFLQVRAQPLQQATQEARVGQARHIDQA